MVVAPIGPAGTVEVSVAVAGASLGGAAVVVGAAVGSACEVVAIPAAAFVKRRVYSTPVAVLTSVIGWSRFTVIASFPPAKAPPTTEIFIVFGPTESSWNQRSPAWKYWSTPTACFLPFA